MKGRVVRGDALTLPIQSASVDTIICDPPYGTNFMHKYWDHGAPGVEFWREALRVTKPGAHLVAFGGTRTFHRLVCAIEDAGWQIRDTLCWLYGSGFPKSANFGNKLDGWKGYGTALKPAWEPIVLAMKPVEGTFAKNALKWGVAGLNVDGCRIAMAAGRVSDKGRWPPNLLFQHAPSCKKNGDSWQCVEDCPAALLDAQSGDRKPGGNLTGHEPRSDGFSGPVFGSGIKPRAFQSYNDNGGASRFFPQFEGEARFFYCPKALREERDAGLDGFEERDAQKWNPGGIKARREAAGQGRARNTHPTVKPVDLMRWLVRLVTRPDHLVLDPFCGSGSTGCAAVLEGRRFIGVDIDRSYVKIADARLRHWGTRSILSRA